MTTTPPTTRIALLSLAIAISQLATSLYLPSLPAMSHEFHVDPPAASWTLTAFYIGFALCNLVAGPLADAHGRRPILLAGLAIYVAGTLVCATATGIVPLLLGRLVQAAGASVAPVVGRAMLRDVQGADPNDPAGTKAMIWISIAMAASPAAGPPLGGLIQQTLGWRYAFWTLAIAGLAMLLLVYARLDETQPRTARARIQRLARRYAALLADAPFCCNVGALSALFACLGVFFATGPFIFIQTMGYSPITYGLLNLANVAGYLAGSALAGRLARRIPPAGLVRLGTSVALGGGILLVALAALGIARAWSVLGPVTILTIGFGMVLPAATAAALNRHPTQAGLASALLGFLQIAAAAAGTAIAGALLGGGLLPVTCVFLGLAILAALCARRAPATTLRPA